MPASYAGDVSLSGGTAESPSDIIEHRRKESGRDERRRAHGVSGRSRPLSAGPDDRIDGHTDGTEQNRKGWRTDPWHKHVDRWQRGLRLTRESGDPWHRR